MLIEFAVKGVKFSVDAAKLTPESITKAFNKAHSRVAAERWTGKQEKSLTLEQLQTEAKNFAADPNQFWAKYGTRAKVYPGLSWTCAKRQHVTILGMYS